MRVAIVAPSLESSGGESAQARVLRDNLQRAGHEVRVVPIDPSFARLLAWVRRVPYARAILNELYYLPSLVRLMSTEVVFVFAASHGSFLLTPVPAVAAARLFGRRVVLAYHRGDAAHHLHRWGRLVRPWLRMADELIVASEYLESVFRQNGYRTRVIRNILDTSRFRYRERRPLQPRLISVRHLERPYRVEDTLWAFSILRSLVPGASLTVAGAGSEEARLRRLARDLGPEGIRFVGHVAPEAMPRLYDEADFLVNASVIDDQPVSVLEAFAAGVAVVSTATGDIPAMVGHGSSGRLVRHEDPEDMALAIVELLRHPERTRAMTRRAHDEIEKYQWPCVRQDWEAVLQVA